MKKKFSLENLIDYVKITLITLLAVIEIVVCASSYSLLDRAGFIALIVCCFLLAAIETVNTFVIKGFVVKMVFYGLDSALLLTICIFTGNSFLSTLYCIVLTGCYITVDKFKDKTILFICSCVLFVISFIIGWVIRNPGSSAYTVFLGITSGVLFGLLAMALDFTVTLFLLKFYKTNRGLSAALKAANESKARLEEAYEQLTRAKVYEERNRIAKDIHDNAGHSMTTVIMQTEAAKLLIDNNPAEAKNRIISANIQARNALEQMRESVHLLAGREQPRSLKEEMREIIAQTIDGTDLKARYDLEDVQLTEEGHRFLCNSVKELLSNGIRHGKATAFYLEIKEVGGAVKILVSDNGEGVNGKIKEGFGLKSIRDKAENLGGTCVFSGDEGEGFEARIELPKENNDD